MGFAGLRISSGQRKDKGEPDGREEGEVKKGESLFLLQRKVRWAGGFGLNKYKPSHASHPQGSLLPAGQSLSL